MPDIRPLLHHKILESINHILKSSRFSKRIDFLYEPTWPIDILVYLETFGGKQFVKVAQILIKLYEHRQQKILHLRTSIYIPNREYGINARRVVEYKTREPTVLFNYDLNIGRRLTDLDTKDIPLIVSKITPEITTKLIEYIRTNFRI